MAQFIFETDESNGNFRIVSPDDTASEWSEPGELCAVDYNGMMYFATDVASTGEEGYPGMAPGVVYGLGAAMQTERAAYDPEGEGEADGEGDEDDGPTCPACDAALDLGTELEVDDLVTCGNCDAQLTVVSVDPVVLEESEGGEGAEDGGAN